MSVDRSSRPHGPKHSAGLETTEYFMMDLRIRIDGENDMWSDDVRTGRDFLHLPREIQLFPGSRIRKNSVALGFNGGSS